jgi:hypothetical protein
MAPTVPERMVSEGWVGWAFAVLARKGDDKAVARATVAHAAGEYQNELSIEPLATVGAFHFKPCF